MWLNVVRVDRSPKRLRAPLETLKSDCCVFILSLPTPPCRTLIAVIVGGVVVLFILCGLLLFCWYK